MAIDEAQKKIESLTGSVVSLQELLGRADAVSLQVVYASRFKGWLNERVLNHCKPGQLWVGVSRSAVFDPEALALALTDGRIDACLLDGASPSFAAEGTPLYGIPNLHLTPRLGSHTREAKLRASWYVAHRVHETLSPMVAQAEARLRERVVRHLRDAAMASSGSRTLAIAGNPVRMRLPAPRRAGR